MHKYSIGVFSSNRNLTSPLHFIRFTCRENKDAARELMHNYSEEFVGNIMLKILEYHLENEVTYVLSDEAEKLFEEITDKYRGQFNLKYASCSQVTDSQPELNTEEKSEISVRTKATELIGRLSCVFWVYCNGKTFI